jgi:hypothetical protein
MNDCSQSQSDEHAGPLAEFVALRSEYERRATTMWNVLALQITIAGAIFGFAISGQRREILLLVIPIATYMTCGRYVIHCQRSHLIAVYFHTSLSKRIPGGLHWEEWAAANERRYPVGHFAVVHHTGIVFPGVSTLAICAFAISALSSNLAGGKTWYAVVATIAVVAIDVTLTALVVFSIWKARHFRAAGVVVLSGRGAGSGSPASLTTHRLERPLENIYDPQMANNQVPDPNDR